MSNNRKEKEKFFFAIFDNYEMNFTYCVLLVYNDNGSVQTLCITRVSALCTKCLHGPIVIINQQYTKGEIHFIYLHYFHVFGFCFINRYHGNGCVSLENPTVYTVNGRAKKKIVLCDSNLVTIDKKKKINISQSFIITGAIVQDKMVRNQEC